MDLLTELRRLRGLGGERAHGGLQIRHQERGGNAFADDVRDGETQASGSKRDRVVAIAADARCRLPRCRELTAIELG